jgi:hypothetical protein
VLNYYCYQIDFYVKLIEKGTGFSLNIPLFKVQILKTKIIHFYINLLNSVSYEKILPVVLCFFCICL